MTQAQTITSKAKSNLAFALIDLPEEERRHMAEFYAFCRSDICQQQPLNRDELLDYTYCVACCVGLTSARIMGAGEAAYPYAIALGHALQMVNIIRDVAEDCGKSNRIYLPREDMDRFGYTLEDLRGRVYSPQLQELLQYEADLASVPHQAGHRPPVLLRQVQGVL